MAIDVDAILREIGEFGPFQKRAFLLLCLPSILVGSANLAYVFIAASPKYRCAIPGCDNATYPSYDSDFVNFTIPYLKDGRELDQCHHYIRVNSSIEPDTCFSSDFNMTLQDTCKNGSVFDNSVYLSTIVSEFDLTCHNAWEANMVQTIYFGGILVGSLISGYMGDRLGRILTFTIGIVGMASFGVTAALVSSLPGLNFTRFMSAVMATAVFQTSFILATEFVGPKMRVTCGVLPQYFFAFGEILLGLVSWGIKEWRMIQLLISGPVSCFVFYWFFIPESPRWLLAKGRHRKAVAVLEKIAKKNKKTIPQEFLEVSEEADDDSDMMDSLTDARKVSMLDVIRRPILCIRMFSMFYIWIVITLVYYALSMNAVALGESNNPSAPFVDFILTSLVEIPGYSLSWLCMSWFGRRWTMIMSLILAGISCGGAGFCAEYGEDYIIIPFLFGKCFITCTFSTVYMFTMEMFPTRVRSTILGLCSTFARVGAMLAPFSSSLEEIYGPLPMIVFGSLSIVAGLLNCIMPETKKTLLPETIADAVNLGRSRSVPVQEESRTSEEAQSLLGEESQDDQEAPFSDGNSSDVGEGIDNAEEEQ
ncbi:organic cation transporter protein-like isoform X2 [Macrobrachium rosenbergii]|uniref:organic cation transporter protein-like isoform X2 n=1 Tax=Macrobrachium rosenbergii TaxID=79674 RepID=UPI0034D3B41F